MTGFYQVEIHLSKLFSAIYIERFERGVVNEACNISSTNSLTTHFFLRFYTEQRSHLH